MRGTNILHLNEATMLEAVDLWLASEYKNPPKAAAVAADAHRGYKVTVKTEPEVLGKQ